MKREIKFRAKHFSGIIKEWFYGTPVPTDFGSYYMLEGKPEVFNNRLSFSKLYSTPIDEDTIGQFTGLKYFNGPDDKKGKEIYDGDIIASGKNNEIKHVIAYHDEDAQYVAYYSKTDYCGVNQKWINEFKKVVIGNIYDNPELLNK